MKGIKGFTLIELMLVVVIIGALVAMVMPRLTGRGEQAKVAAAKADIEANIATALKLYELDNGEFPSTAEGLTALLQKVSNAPGWKGPYLEKNRLTPGAESINTVALESTGRMTMTCIHWAETASRAMTMW